jgi:hypothetical protein
LKNAPSVDGLRASRRSRGTVSLVPCSLDCFVASLLAMTGSLSGRAEFADGTDYSADFRITQAIAQALGGPLTIFSLMKAPANAVKSR